MASSANTPTFSERLRALPTGPGVYLMRAADSEVLYVGKAANLRNRVSGYFFGSPAGMPPKIRQLVRRVADFEFIVTESEQEALILESNLIKERQPQYNARLKDDKSYPFIKIDSNEDFPLVYLTRRVKDDGARYFGPFASAYSVRKTLAVLKKLFPYRSCTKTITGKDDRVRVFVRSGPSELRIEVQVRKVEDFVWAQHERMMPQCSRWWVFLCCLGARRGPAPTAPVASSGVLRAI